MFEFIKNFASSVKKEQFNQKFWSNADVAIFARYNHIDPNLDNITQDKKVLKLLMSFDSSPTINKFLKLSQYTYTKDDKNYPTLNVMYFYLMKNGALFIKDRAYDKKSYIVSEDNTHFSLPEAKPSTNCFFDNNEMNFLVILDALQTDLHYNYKPENQLHPEILKHIANKQDFKSIFIGNDNLHYLLKAIQEKNWNKSYEKYFENFLDVTFKNQKIKDLIAFPEHVEELINQYDIFLEKKKINQEKCFLDSHLVKNDMIPFLKAKRKI